MSDTFSISDSEREALDRLIRHAQTLEMHAEAVAIECREVTQSAERLRDRYVDPADYMDSNTVPQYDSIAREIEYYADHDMQRMMSGLRGFSHSL